jgi:Putative DNA-binding domain
VTDEEPQASGDSPRQPLPDTFVDRRTDYEKLVELLTFTEGTHLEFKAELNLGSKEAKLKFVKDVVAMSNCPPGGYILIGVDNSGDPCTRIGTIDRNAFDGARLGDLVRSYVEGRVDMQVAIHDHGEHEIVLIRVFPHRGGLPVPMSKVGNYPDPEDPSRQLTAFRQGELPVREGAANVPLRGSHWAVILSEYTREIRSQGAELAQAMLREFLDDRTRSRNEPASNTTAAVPLLIDMDEPTFVATMEALLETRDDVRLRRFLRTSAKPITSRASMGEFETALDKWTIFCARALYAERTDLVAMAIESLHDAYVGLGLSLDDTRKRLEVVIRIYALGRLAISEAAWEIIHALSLQPVRLQGGNYVYSSWIRYGQVDASRANLIPNDRGGFLISAARELLLERSAMRPDIEDDEIPPAAKPPAELAADDVILNALAQFDIAYCFVVAAEGKHAAGYYPSSAALREHRSAPIADRIVAKADVRERLFPNSDDSEVARALADVYEMAGRESSRYTMWWDTPPSVARFIEQHPWSAD